MFERATGLRRWSTPLRPFHRCRSRVRHPTRVTVRTHAVVPESARCACARFTCCRTRNSLSCAVSCPTPLGSRRRQPRCRSGRTRLPARDLHLSRSAPYPPPPGGGGAQRVTTPRLCCWGSHASGGGRQAPTHLIIAEERNSTNLK